MQTLEKNDCGNQSIGKSWENVGKKITNNNEKIVQFSGVSMRIFELAANIYCNWFFLLFHESFRIGRVAMCKSIESKSKQSKAKRDDKLFKIKTHNWHSV